MYNHTHDIVFSFFQGSRDRSGPCLLLLHGSSTRLNVLYNLIPSWYSWCKNGEFVYFLHDLVYLIPYQGCSVKPVVETVTVLMESQHLAFITFFPLFMDWELPVLVADLSSKTQILVPSAKVLWAAFCLCQGVKIFGWVMYLRVTTIEAVYLHQRNGGFRVLGGKKWGCGKWLHAAGEQDSPVG